MFVPVHQISELDQQVRIFNNWVEIKHVKNLGRNFNNFEISN